MYVPSQKNQNIFIVYLNGCLDIAIRIFIDMVKKTCAENFSSLVVFLICPDSWICH